MRDHENVVFVIQPIYPIVEPWKHTYPELEKFA